MVHVFGFMNEFEFSRDEFSLYLDCLFRGLPKCLILNTEYMPNPPARVRRVKFSEIDRFVNEVFQPDEIVLARDNFIEYIDII